MTTLAAYQGWCLDSSSGRIVAGAQVTCRREVDAVLPTIYSDEAGASPLGNPMTANSNGFFRFYVAAGKYKISASVGALLSEPLRNVLIGTAAGLDVADILAGVYGTPIVIAAAGTQTVSDDTGFIVLNLSSAGTVNLTLGAVAARNGLPLVIADFTGNATVVITPDGTETINNKTSPDRTWTMAAGGGAGLGNKMMLAPVDDLGDWTLTVG